MGKLRPTHSSVTPQKRREPEKQAAFDMLRMTVLDPATYQTLETFLEATIEATNFMGSTGQLVDKLKSMQIDDSARMAFVHALATCNGVADACNNDFPGPNSASLFDDSSNWVNVFYIVRDKINAQRSDNAYEIMAQALQAACRL